MLEKHLITELKQGNKEAFSLLFKRYYKDLVLFGGNFLYDRIRCEDIVQNIFTKLWINKADLEIEVSLKSFLLTSVRNACLDELRHKNIIREHAAYTEKMSELFDSESMSTENYILYSDLHDHLTEALKKVPENYREAFVKHRFDGLKYKEIAQELGVSERTVEVRIGKTLEILRKLLKDFFFITVVSVFRIFIN